MVIELERTALSILIVVRLANLKSLNTVIPEDVAPFLGTQQHISEEVPVIYLYVSAVGIKREKTFAVDIVSR